MPAPLPPLLQARSFADFLMPMLNFVPSKRATAGQMLQHPWLRGETAAAPAAQQPSRRSLERSSQQKQRSNERSRSRSRSPKRSRLVPCLTGCLPCAACCCVSLPACALLPACRRVACPVLHASHVGTARG